MDETPNTSKLRTHSNEHLEEFFSYSQWYMSTTEFYIFIDFNQLIKWMNFLENDLLLFNVYLT